MNGALKNCHLFDNGGLGVRALSGGPIDAAGPNGPNGAGVSGFVTFSPFLTVPVIIP